MVDFEKQKLTALVEKLRKEQYIEGEQKPFFSFGRDVYHKKELCFFCGFTGNIHGEGRYIYSPLSDMAEEDGLTQKQVMAAAIFFCGACLKNIEELDLLEIDFG